jgi:predicted Rossmann fold flavoprotein
MNQIIYDAIIVGSGAAGIMAALASKTPTNKILIVEQLPKIATKLKATGGGKCNITNTLSTQTFMEHFGKNGMFLRECLERFSSHDLIDYLHSIGLETRADDGFRIFPITRKSDTIIQVLYDELLKQKIEIITNYKVIDIEKKDDIFYVKSLEQTLQSKNVVLASGGLGYPTLGATGEGFEISKKFGHKVSKLYPAMMPLHTKEKWVAKCTADTVARVPMEVDIKKHKNKKAVGDLIFTKSGIRGPVVLDFAREITPLFDKYDEIPLVMRLIKNKSEDDVIKLFKEHPTKNILEVLESLLATNIIKALLEYYEIDYSLFYKNLEGNKKQKLLQILTKTPLTISGHDGFKMAMITRGGVSLKEINPNSMMSKKIDNLYFCGEIVDIDGPCGGYNLQWSFSSGYQCGYDIKHNN